MFGIEGLEDGLRRMTDHASSIVLSWDEDANMWECSIISSGERFTSIENDPLDAYLETMQLLRDAALD